MPDPAPVACASCGRTPRADEAGAAGAPGRAPFTWSLETGDGRVSHRCPECTRGNARSIEAKLDDHWWE
ncbi:hypothetical protein HJ590_04620 [Naumannella sp. ID2617S]|uniref:Uncharacterized protein n=1 Tax=Enemella dayhoffiae TaxID=2016507 RepID=A0A255GUK2_9ACTN|nr:hypothetical protein [Enemella dayhoffiae]NNG18864.1 hypothetical protein [Naumannella sp. ID2617S]OYO19379.1 hypothetical protein CGZ93_13545 [Enemella dayhoffiae]